MAVPKGWKDRLEIREHRRYGRYFLQWIVWDDLNGEDDGAQVGDLPPKEGSADDDPEFSAVHRAVEAFWKANPHRASFRGDTTFYFDTERQAKEAVKVANAALREVRAARRTKK